MIRRDQIIIVAALSVAVALVVGIYVWSMSPSRTALRASLDGGEGADSGRSPASAGRRPICKDLYLTICHKNYLPEDPTGDVKPDLQGESKTWDIYESLAQEHTDWNSDQIEDELVKRIYTPKRLKQLQETYLWIEKTLEHIINSQPREIFTRSEKRNLIARLRRTELELPPPASIYADEPDLFTKNDAYYEHIVLTPPPPADPAAPGPRLEPKHIYRLRIGGAYLVNGRSRFNMIFTLAHELSHAIDPCEIRTSGYSLPAYDRLTACFLRHQLIAIRRTRTECGRNDQLSETFADWMAVQVVGEALGALTQGYTSEQLESAAANSVQDLCEQEDYGEPDMEFHPAPRTRIQNIFGLNPVIRQKLGCETSEEVRNYCKLE